MEKKNLCHNPQAAISIKGVMRLMLTSLRRIRTSGSSCWPLQQQFQRICRGHQAVCSATNNSNRGPSMSAIQLAVCGLHMRGQKLEHQLTDLGANFSRTCRSSPIYELYAITDPAAGTCKPGMIAVGPAKGESIELDIWDLPIESLGKFFLQIPAPLGLGTVCLDDGSSVKGFICEGYIASLGDGHSGHSQMQSKLQVENITKHASWKQYLKQRTHV